LGGVGTFLQKGSDKTDGESRETSREIFLLKNGGNVVIIKNDEA